MAEAGAAIRARTRRRVSARVVWLLLVLVALVVWLAAGHLRATAIAGDYFVRAHGAGASVTNVQVEGAGPAIPPFWSVTISGDVIEAGRTTPAYTSHMILWVEPVTGWVFVNGAG